MTEQGRGPSTMTRNPRTESGRGAVALMPGALDKEGMRRLIVPIEEEAAATERRLTVDEVNKHWDALIAQAVAGELTDRQLIQSMNGYFDDLATADVDEEAGK